MFARLGLMGLLLVGGLGVTGCGTPGEEQIKVQQVDRLEEAKRLLQNYANGQPVTSEATSFPKLVEDVKKTDPAKGEILEKGLAEIQASPATAADKAKEVLSKL
jgi:hypothetical protein